MEVSMVFLTSEMNIFRQFPSKHAGSDPEEFWLRPGIAITASVQPESGRIVYTRSDFPHPFQFRFSEEGMDHTVQDRAGSSLDGLVKVWPNLDGLVKVWPNLDGLVKVWPNASGPEASRCTGIIGPGFWQDATGPQSVSHFQTRFGSSTDDPDNTVKNQPGSDLVLADCVRFWPNGSGPEAKPIRTGCESDPACLLGLNS